MYDQEQQVIEWFQSIWNSYRYDQDTRDEITEFVQNIINVNRLDENQLMDLGFEFWRCASEITLIQREYTQPEVNEEMVKWWKIGDYLTDLLDVEPYQREYNDCDDDADW